MGPLRLKRLQKDQASHGIALDTPHAYILTKIKLGQKWSSKTEESGQNSPFEALADEMWAQYIQVSSFNIPASTILWDGGH